MPHKNCISANNSGKQWLVIVAITTFSLAGLTLPFLNRARLSHPQQQQQQQQLQQRQLSLTDTYHDTSSFRILSPIPEKLLDYSRAFPTWSQTHPNGASWCVTNHNNNHNEEPNSGLIYVKNYKTGSATIAGLTLRIARRHAKQQQQQQQQRQICRNHPQHAPGYTYRQRSRRSFLFTSIRHPTSRAVSHVWFQYVSREGMIPTDDDAIIDKLRFITDPFPLRWEYDGNNNNNGRDDDNNWRNDKYASFQLAYTSLRPPSELRVNRDVLRERGMSEREWEKQLVNEIVHDYDLIMVTERMNESLIVLKLILDLDMGDLLYLSSQVSGKQYGKYNNKCTKLISKPDKLSYAVKDFLESKEWMDKIAGDVLLHTAANRCLDRTIESLGRDRFERELEFFQRLLNRAEKHCGRKAIWPCGQNGELNEEGDSDCEKGTQGCGSKCLDYIGTTFKTT